MDSSMTQLVAQKFGLNAEQYDALQNGDPSPLIANNRLDPMMAAMLSSMMNKRDASSDEPEPRDDYEEALARAQKRIQHLKEQVAAAYTMANFIAETFGACRTCWGLNKMCPRCGGKGKPGFTEPAEEELRNWVEPALGKLGLKIVRAE